MMNAQPAETAMRDPENKTVSIVIVNYNGAALLEPCLASVFAQPYRPIDVIVVDNASKDGSVEMVKRMFPHVRLLVNDANLGFAEANNRGVALALGDMVVLLNNDTVVDSGWLTALLRAVCNPGIGVVTSKVVTEGVPALYYEMNGSINYLGYNIMREFHDLSAAFFAGGASLIFSKSKVGMPFLTEYFLYHEDVFLSWRMRLRGFGVLVAQESLVHHVGSATTRRQPSTLVTFYQERNRFLNCLLFYERRTLTKLLPMFLADAIAKFILSLAVRRKSPAGILRAYWWCLRNRAWIAAQRRALQHERKVGDDVILRMMSVRLIDSQGMTARLVNRVARFYADTVGLAYHA